MNLQSASEVRRNDEIDGIRGWAALIVVLFHLFVEIFGVVMPEFRRRRYWFFLDGDLAVFVFFVLSGDALSVGFLATGGRGVIDRLVAKRYFRLTIPIALACFIAYLLMKIGLTFNLQAAPVVMRKDWLGAMLDFEPSLRSLVRYSLFDVYANPFGRSYNNFMWTMSLELTGSILVFVFLYLSSALKRPGIAAATITVGLYAFNSWYALFFAGIAFAYLRRAGYLERLHASRGAQVVIAIAMVIVVVAVCAVHRLESLSRSSFFFNEAAAIMVVGLIYSSNLALRLFRCVLSRWLGRISFPLYLVQFCVFVSITSYLIQSEPLTLMRVGFISGISLSACLVAAVFFQIAEQALLSRLDATVRRHLIPR